MLYNLKLFFPNQTNDNDAMRPNRYFYWEFLMLLVLGRSETFEIVCNAEDHEAIEFGSKYGKRVGYEESVGIAYSGNVNMRVRYQLVARYRNMFGLMKWESLYLYRGKEIVFSSRDYGTKLYITGLNEKNKTAIERFKQLKNDAIVYELLPAEQKP